MIVIEPDGIPEETGFFIFRKWRRLTAVPPIYNLEIVGTELPAETGGELFYSGTYVDPSITWISSNISDFIPAGYILIHVRAGIGMVW